MPATRRLAVGLAVLIAVVGVVLGYLAPTASGPGPLPVDDTVVSGQLAAAGGPYLTDIHGRVVFLRGVNAVYKRAPYELYADPGKGGTSLPPMPPAWPRSGSTWSAWGSSGRA